MVKKYKKKDPHRQREAEKYTHPIPSREYISEYLEEIGRPVSFSHLIEAFGLTSDEEQEGLRRRLQAMSRDGQLISNRRGSYALVDRLSLIAGRVLAVRDGSGYLQPEDGSEDIFLPAREMSNVFNLDRVLVRIVGISARGRREGSITEVIERNTHQVVGRYIEEAGIAFVDPNNRLIHQDIIIPVDQRNDAKHGQFVVAEITAQPRLRRQPLGRVIEILGDQLTPGMEVELAIRSHQLPFIWPQSALDEAQALPAKLQPKDYRGRIDLRALNFVTIDGEDAKDFDDAVYCEPIAEKKSVSAAKTNHGKALFSSSSLTGPCRLYVAIADVSHYVNVGSALDQEAHNRGNSVYFPNKVIPMLPEILSNGLCSLNPNQDRLVLVCIMDFDAAGELQHYTFQSAVIHSQARLTYRFVADMLSHYNRDQSIVVNEIKTKPYAASIFRLYELYKKLYQHRVARGAIEFDTIETRIIFGKLGKIEEIVPVVRNDAHRLIEEAMLQANTCAANLLEKFKINTLYRVHEGPDPEKLTALRDFLKAFGLRLGGGKNPSPKDYGKLLQRINKRPDAALLQLVLLRSLRQAIYSTENIGHFGLAYPAYTHFTSPIRRYPDLLVHRAIKHLLNKKSVNRFVYDEAEMKLLGVNCSITERRADIATRDAVDWLKCEYMQDKIGMEFDGTICDVTGFGIFVQLNQVYIQGLVHITALRNDYYQHEQVHHLLRGRRTGQVYRLSDPVRVRLVRVDLDQRQIDFELAAPEPNPIEADKSKSKKNKSKTKTKTTVKSSVIKNEIKKKRKKSKAKKKIDSTQK